MTWLLWLTLAVVVAALAAITGMAQRYAMFTQMFGFSTDMTADQAVDTFTEILMNGIKARAI